MYQTSQHCNETFLLGLLLLNLVQRILPVQHIFAQGIRIVIFDIVPRRIDGVTKFVQENGSQFLRLECLKDAVGEEDIHPNGVGAVIEAILRHQPIDGVPFLRRDTGIHNTLHGLCDVYILDRFDDDIPEPKRVFEGILKVFYGLGFPEPLVLIPIVVVRIDHFFGSLFHLGKCIDDRLNALPSILKHGFRVVHVVIDVLVAHVCIFHKGTYPKRI